MNRAQRRVQELLQEAVSSGRERGIQVAAYLEGERVVDAWAGSADPEGTRAVHGDSLFPIFSTTKGIAATVLHVLAEQGKVDYDAPIARYWPEFAAHGKEATTVRQALAHTAGLPNLPTGLAAADLGDWDRMCRALAALPPAWPAGSRFEYHAITFSWLVGEVACRAGGRTFPELLTETVCRPLAIRDLYVGIPAAIDSQVAILEDPQANPEMLKAPDGSPIPGWVCPLHAWMNTTVGRQACVPASTGVASARAIAKHYAALVPGGVGAVELLSSRRRRLACEPQRLLDGTRLNRGLGYMLGGEKGSIYGPRHTAFGHGGYGGSVGFADPKYRFALGLTKNLYSAGGVQGQVVTEIRRLLGIP